MENVYYFFILIMEENIVKFYKCSICGNIITVIEGNEKLIKCCGHEMEELVSNCVDAAVEKHVPIYEKVENIVKVKVGEIEHPMLDEHYIMFVASVVEDSINIIKLNPGASTEVTFNYSAGMKIYSYCNLHGLWVNEIL